jgi:vacuolar protein sorting-associated protein 13A/C
MKGVGKGLLSGVTGVFTAPVKEAKKGGIGGFFKGIGKGVVGLAAKPAESVVDLVSKTTEGLENSALGKVECPTRFIRAREPRAFYGPEKYVKPYNEEDALAC